MSSFSPYIYETYKENQKTDEYEDDVEAMLCIMLIELFTSKSRLPNPEFSGSHCIYFSMSLTYRVIHKI